MTRVGALIFGILWLPGAWAAGKDGLWELTTQMEMEGMPSGFSIPGMPGGASKQTLCIAEGKQYEPEEQKECKVLEQRTSGKKSFARIKCKEGTMTVEHEELSKSHWRSKMVMTGEDAMTVKTEGKRVGSCDAKSEGGMSRETAKVMEGAQAQSKQSAAELTRSCQKAVTDWPRDNPFPSYDQIAKQRKDALAGAKGDAEKKMVNTMYPDAPGCAAAKAEYCNKGKAVVRGTRAAYQAADRQGGGALNDALSYCGLDRKAAVSAFCKSALAESDVSFIVSLCPAERKVLSDRHCAGRDYTSVDKRFQAVCLAGSTNKSGRDYTAVGSSGQTDAVGEGVKVLKGLFGF